MFTNYEIKKLGYDDVIYLYLDLAYEFGNDLFDDNSIKNITEKCKTFINNNDINFKGNKIYLVIDGIIVKSLDLRSIN